MQHVVLKVMRAEQSWHVDNLAGIFAEVDSGQHGQQMTEEGTNKGGRQQLGQQQTTPGGQGSQQPSQDPGVGLTRPPRPPAPLAQCCLYNCC